MKKLSIPLPLLLASVLLIPSANASGDGDLWAALAMSVCMAQDEAYLQTTLGKQLSAHPEYQRAKEGAMGKMLTCMATKQPMPDALCRTLLNETEASIQLLNLGSLYEKYESSIQPMGKAQQQCMSSNAR